MSKLFSHFKSFFPRFPGLRAAAFCLLGAFLLAACASLPGKHSQTPSSKNRASHAAAASGTATSAAPEPAYWPIDYQATLQVPFLKSKIMQAAFILADLCLVANTGMIRDRQQRQFQRFASIPAKPASQRRPALAAKTLDNLTAFADDLIRTQDSDYIFAGNTLRKLAGHIRARETAETQNLIQLLERLYPDNFMQPDTLKPVDQTRSREITRLLEKEIQACLPACPPAGRRRLKALLASDQALREMRAVGKNQ